MPRLSLQSVIPVLVTGIQVSTVNAMVGDGYSPGFRAEEDSLIALCITTAVLVTGIQVSTVDAMSKRGYVYILASQKNGTLYTGVTSDLPGRLLQHHMHTGSKFAARYRVMRLVWFDEFELITTAITREKTIKKWPRQWKINLIEERNPHWHDISWHLL